MFDDGERNTEYDSRYCRDENDEWYNTSIRLRSLDSKNKRKSSWKHRTVHHCMSRTIWATSWVYVFAVITCCYWCMVP